MRIAKIIIFLFIAVTAAAQQKVEMTNLTEFEKRLQQETEVVKSIESDFIQTKYLDIFDEKIFSKGKFYYKKANKIRMDYNSPMNYLIVINDGRLKIVSDGKKSVMNLDSNKMMNQMQDMLTACMVGDLSKMSTNYQLRYFQDANYYYVEIKPMNKEVQAYINLINIQLSKQDMSVVKLRLSETATNYTEYEFTNKKYNSLPDEELFAVR